MNILLSIVIPCYNDGHYLKEALQSLEQAKFEFEYEVLVVNDGSTDKNTLDFLQSLTYPIKVLHQENKGLGAARNAALQKARGKFILPLDSDNKINGGNFKKALSFMQQKEEVDVLFSDVITFKDGLSDKKKKLTVPEFHRASIFLSNYIDACALYKKSNWERVGGYDEKMPFMGYEDWDFWLKSCKEGLCFKKFDNPFFEYRIRSSSMIHTKQNYERHKIVYKYLINKHLDEYVEILFRHRKSFSYFLRKPLKAGFKNYLNQKD